MTGAGPSLRGRRVTVMGLGLFGGGAGAARRALREGADVTVTDLRDAELLADQVEGLRDVDGAGRLRLVLGRHEAEDFERADVVIVNPAVPPASPWLDAARDAGAEITTATALLFERLRARVIAITGTHGKSSTARFTHDLLAASVGGSARVVLGGNIGGSLLGDVDTLGPDDVVVLELSSYQLEHVPDAARDAIDVAALTNVGVDHLERHGTIESYRDAKLRLFDLLRPGGTAIAPHGELGDLAAARLGRPVVSHGPGGDVVVDADGAIRHDDTTLGDANALRVPGAFQRANLAVALAAAHALGAPADRLAETVPTLGGLPHRMESLGTFTIPRASRPIEVVDNGVSTTPESTLAALESFPDREPRVLVAGGQAKRGVDDDALARRLAAGGWTLVPFGAAAERLTSAARAAGARIAAGPAPETAEDAARAAHAVAADEQASLVLFSPACASFDRYPNFETRALAFREAIRAGTMPTSSPGSH